MEMITDCVQVNMWTKAITDYLHILERMKEITKLPCQDSNQFFFAECELAALVLHHFDQSERNGLWAQPWQLVVLFFQVKLVDGEGIINPKAFYNYLSAWASNDALAYGASQANLRPEPKPWFHVAEDFELKIPKSAPLIYTQLPFYLHGLGDTQHITHLIAQVHNILLINP